MNITLLGALLLGLTTSAASGTECQTSHRDHQWEGYSHADIVLAVGAIKKSHEFSIALPSMAPAQMFRIGSAAEAIWVLEASRKFETIRCDSPAVEEYQWEFAIIQASWDAGGVTSCQVHRKTFVTDEGKPDALSDVSPFDSTSTCAEFIEKP